MTWSRPSAAKTSVIMFCLGQGARMLTDDADPPICQIPSSARAPTPCK
jgi:hypothetical protein